MTLIPSEVITAWQNTVDELHEDLSTTCTLIFESGQTEVSNVSSGNIGKPPNVVMPYGGKGHGFIVPGHDVMSSQTTSPGQSIQVNETGKSIKARVYHVTKDLERFNIQVADNTNVYEVVTYKKYVPDLLRAKHIILFGTDFPEKTIKAKMTIAPAPYGLAGLYLCRSFWEEI